MRNKIVVVGVVMAALALIGAGCGKTTGADVAKEIGKAKQAEVKDVCKYFPKELVEEAIGKPIVRAANDNQIYDTCQYYTAYTQDFDHTPYGDNPGGPHIIVVLNEENEATARAKSEKDGYKFEKDPSFSWEHYLVTSPGSKTPFRVDLIIDDNSYFMIKSNHFAATDAEIVKIGKRLSERMNNGK
jgi:hypothetical protein